VRKVFVYASTSQNPANAFVGVGALRFYFSAFSCAKTVPAFAQNDLEDTLKLIELE
jgi:hypothetical protein